MATTPQTNEEHDSLLFYRQQIEPAGALWAGCGNPDCERCYGLDAWAADLHPGWCAGCGHVLCDSWGCVYPPCLFFEAAEAMRIAEDGEGTSHRCTEACGMEED